MIPGMLIKVPCEGALFCPSCRAMTPHTLNRVQIVYVCEGTAGRPGCGTRWKLEASSLPLVKAEASDPEHGPIDDELTKATNVKPRSKRDWKKAAKTRAPKGKK